VKKAQACYLRELKISLWREYNEHGCLKQNKNRAGLLGFEKSVTGVRVSNQIAYTVTGKPLGKETRTSHRFSMTDLKYVHTSNRKPYGLPNTVLGI
jgi:hypothetical protein